MLATNPTPTPQSFGDNLQNRGLILEIATSDYSFITYAKGSEKLTFLTP